MNTKSLAPFLLASSILWLSANGARGQCLQWQDIPGVAPATVGVLTTFNDGSGDALYAGGSFTSIGSLANANRIAKWNGSSWSALDTGLNGQVQAMVALNGLNPALYVGGRFTAAGSSPAPGVAKWNGSSWSSLASGLSGPNVSVSALALFDDGSGTALYVGGSFVAAGGVPANNIAKWNGSNWSAVGSGGAGIRGMCVYDDGTGSALYATGIFATPQGNVNIAKWQGSQWSAVGVPTFQAGSGLAVFDDGSGEDLYVSGVQDGGVFKWDGNAWSALPNTGEVFALHVFHDGIAPALYSTGLSPIAKWNGSSWSVISSIYGGALAVFDDGTDSAPDLFAVRTGISKWLGCPGADTPTGVPYCFGDGTGAACPCDPGQAGGLGGGCQNHLGTGGMLRAFGNANVSVDSVSIVASGLPPTAIGLVFQGTQQQSGGLGSTFGDGLLCVNQSVVRLGLRSASGGTLTFGFGVPGDPSISVAGQVPASGGTRNYQHWYRDPAPFCTAGTFNLTNGVRIDWMP